MRTKTLQATIAALSTLRIGREFEDHHGQKVERLSETCVAIGAGYNSLLGVSEYIELATYGESYAGKVVLF